MPDPICYRLTFSPAERVALLAAIKALEILEALRSRPLTPERRAELWALWEKVEEAAPEPLEDAP